MAWQRAAAAAEVPEGGVVGVTVAGTPVALYRQDGALRATHNLCTHGLALLSDGWVEDGAVECPLHQGRFEIRTGRPLCAPVTEALRTFAVREAAGEVFVDLNHAGDAEVSAEAAPTTVVMPDGPVVILGAGQAAAAALRALRATGHAGRVVIVGEEPHHPYERPALSKEVLTGAAEAASCCRLTAADAATLGAELRLGRRAAAVEPAARRVLLEGGEVLPYGALLLATGGRARRLAVPGAELAGVHHLRTLEDAAAIGAALRGAERAVVVGGGFIGLELASSARALGVAVTLLEASPALMNRVLPPALGEAFATLAAAHDVEVRRGAAVTAIRRRGPGLLVETASGAVEADCVLVGIGLEPEVTLACGAGCEIVAGGVATDAEGRTSVPGLWAAGDCAVLRAGPGGAPLRLESWHNAEEGGAAAGRSIAGAAPVQGKRPWFWTDQFGLNVQVLGVARPGDRVALHGTPAAAGAVYTCCDPATGMPNAVVAFGEPRAIRAARALLDAARPFEPSEHGARWLDAIPNTRPEEIRVDRNAEAFSFSRRFAWPAEGLTRIPDWVYTDHWVYEREVERIFHGPTWNYVGLEAEVEKPGDFIRSNVGPTPVIVSRAEDGSIHVFENRCTHRAAEFCRELTGNVAEFVCPYHQWTYDLKGNLQGVPFRRGVDGKGGMPADFRIADHNPRKLTVTTHRGVIFASYAEELESLAEYLGPEVLREFEATFDGRRLKVLGHYRHTLPGNWKLYHENLKDPYHATLLHTFLVTFGLLVAGNKSLMLADGSGRHGVMCSAKSDGATVADDTKKEMRAYKEGMTLADTRLMDFVDEFDSPWSVTMATIWPNLIVQREMNTLGIRQIVPTGPHEFIMKWTMFGFEGDTPEMTRHRLRQGNLMGPAGFLGLEDNEAMKFVQDGMRNVPDGEHVVALDPATPEGTSDTLISESAIRAMYRHWREAMAL